MALTNRDRVGRGMDLLTKGLRQFVVQQLTGGPSGRPSWRPYDWDGASPSCTPQAGRW